MTRRVLPHLLIDYKGVERDQGMPYVSVITASALFALNNDRENLDYPIEKSYTRIYRRDIPRRQHLRICIIGHRVDYKALKLYHYLGLVTPVWLAVGW